MRCGRQACEARTDDQSLGLNCHSVLPILARWNEFVRLRWWDQPKIDQAGLFYNQFHSDAPRSGDHVIAWLHLHRNVLCTFMTSWPALLYGISGSSVGRQCGLNESINAGISEQNGSI